MPGWTDYVQLPVTDSATTLRLFDPNPPQGMTLIPAGSFTMGDTFGEGGAGPLPLHYVYVNAVYMDRCEVSATLWEDVFRWALTNGYSFAANASAKAADHPALQMTWYDAVKWCNARSERDGYVPAYYLDEAFTSTYRQGANSPFVMWNSGYRLPTEAEWEKAARGGAQEHRFPWSNGDSITHAVANYYSEVANLYDTSLSRGYNPTFNLGLMPYTNPVGWFPANAYGLHDMAGNVYEWCWDWHGPYSADDQEDPRGSSSGGYRVIRGGAWNGGSFGCRVADRNYQLPSKATDFVGFRCALPVSVVE